MAQTTNTDLVVDVLGDQGTPATSDKLIFVPQDASPDNWGARLATIVFLGGLLILCVLIVVFTTLKGSPPMASATQTTLAAFRGLAASEKQLHPRYSDVDGDLLADPPSDSERFLSPHTLVIAHYEGDHDDDPPVNWHAFKEHLAAATGKRVVVQEYMQTPDQVAGIVNGKIHIIAPHAADVPYLVNSAGFVPFAMLGTDEAPNGNHMVIAVHPASKIKALADLRGKTVTCTQPNSITGYRAAISLLAREADLLPDVDYRVLYSSGQERSIRGLADGLFEVAAISHDKLQLMRARGRIRDSDLRSIYESHVVPRRTIGYIHNLSPDLADKLRRAALCFKNERDADTESEEMPMHFFAVDYRRDFEFVRAMDNSFDPRFVSTLIANDLP